MTAHNFDRFEVDGPQCLHSPSASLNKTQCQKVMGNILAQCFYLIIFPFNKQYIKKTIIPAGEKGFAARDQF